MFLLGLEQRTRTFQSQALPCNTKARLDSVGFQVKELLKKKIKVPLLASIDKWVILHCLRKVHALWSLWFVLTITSNVLQRHSTALP